MKVMLTFDSIVQTWKDWYEMACGHDVATVHHIILFLAYTVGEMAKQFYREKSAALYSEFQCRPPGELLLLVAVVAPHERQAHQKGEADFPLLKELNFSPRTKLEYVLKTIGMIPVTSSPLSDGYLDTFTNKAACVRKKRLDQTKPEASQVISSVAAFNSMPPVVVAINSHPL